MRINIAQNANEIEVIPSIYKSLENPPKFIFRSPTSLDCLNFLWGGNNVFEAVCNCFVRFENKIELYHGDKPIEYNTYKEFVSVGLSGDIALIHNECMNAVFERLNTMVTEAQKTEKKLQSATLSSKKTAEKATQNT